jgi:hypothetical protein
MASAHHEYVYKGVVERDSGTGGQVGGGGEPDLEKKKVDPLSMMSCDRKW